MPASSLTRSCSSEERTLGVYLRARRVPDTIEQLQRPLLAFEVEHLLQQRQRQVIALAGKQLLHLGRREVGVMGATDT